MNPAPSYATIYVDGALSEDCTNGEYSIANRDNSGSDGVAFRSVKDALTVAQGDTEVIVRDGRYEEGPGYVLPVAVTLKGYEGERPVIACNGIDNGTVVDARQDSQIKNVEIEGTFDLGVGDLYSDVSIQINGTGVLIEKCLLSKWSHAAIKQGANTNADGLIIRENVIPLGGCQLGDHAIYLSDEDKGGGHVIIQNNVIYDSITYGINVYHCLEVVDIIGNLIFRCSHGGLLIDHNDHKIYNNTICYNGHGERGDGGGNQHGVHFFHYWLHNIDFRNNLVWGNLGVDIGVDISSEEEALTNCTFGNNLYETYWNNYPPPPTGAGDINVEPKFVVPSPVDWPDFRLDASSPAIGAGAEIGASMLDAEQVDWPVPVEGNKNIGAFI